MNILIVGDLFSIQTAFWVRPLVLNGWNVHIYDPRNGIINSELKGVIIHTGWKKRCSNPENKVFSRYPLHTGRYFIEKHMPKIWKTIVGIPEKNIYKIVKKHNINILHSLGMWSYSEAVLHTIKKYNNLQYIPWIYSSKGSDIYYWQQYSGNIDTIKEILCRVHYFMANHKRDYDLAIKYGFRGKLLGYFQGMGGYDVSYMHAMIEQNIVSKRKGIAIKGLDHYAGRASIALKAIRELKNYLINYDIYIYQAQKHIQQMALEMKRELGLNIYVIQRTGPETIWRTFAKCKLSIGISVSDGVPNSMLESKIMGALPIQSIVGGTIEDWIEDGVNGIIIRNNTEDEIKMAIKKAIEEDVFVDKAARINMEIIAKRIDCNVVYNDIKKCYLYVKNNNIHK